MAFTPIAELLNQQHAPRGRNRSDGVTVAMSKQGRAKPAITFRLGESVVDACRFRFGDRLAIDLDRESCCLLLRPATASDGDWHWKLGQVNKGSSGIMKLTWIKGLPRLSSSFAADYSAEPGGLMIQLLPEHFEEA